MTTTILAAAFAALALLPPVQDDDRSDAPLSVDPRPEAAELLRLVRIRQVGTDDHCGLGGVMRLTGEMQVQMMPLKGSFEELLHPAGMARFTFRFAGYPDTVDGTDGRLFWEESAMGVDVRRGWRAAAPYRISALLRYVPWTTLYSAATVDGAEVVDGERCWRVVLTPKSPAELGLPPGPEDESVPAPDVWFVGANSLLVRRIELQVTVPNRGPGTLAFGYGDWRIVDGALVPFIRSREMHGFKATAIVKEVETRLEIGDDAFAPSEKVLEAAGPRPDLPPLTDPGWKIVELEEQHVASVRTQCAPAEIGSALTGILPEVMRYLGQKGVRPTGAPYTRYHAMGAEEVDLEGGMPVAEAIESSGRIQASKLPGGRAVQGVHVGTYDRLGEAHANLAQWIEKNGEKAAGGPWEVYLTDPGLEPDPTKWRTLIVQPLAARD